MKLRKKQIKVPKNFSAPPWRMKNLYRGISKFLHRAWRGVDNYRLIPILRCWGRKPPAKKLTEVNGDAVEEEVSIASSIVDGDKALEVLVECFC